MAWSILKLAWAQLSRPVPGSACVAFRQIVIIWSIIMWLHFSFNTMSSSKRASLSFTEWGWLDIALWNTLLSASLLWMETPGSDQSEVVMLACMWGQVVDRMVGWWWPGMTWHRSQIGRYNCLNCTTKVVYYIFTSTSGVVGTHFWTNPRIQVFWENQFFSFCEAPKNFFWP